MGGRGTEQDGTVCTTTAASTLYTVLYNLLLLYVRTTRPARRSPIRLGDDCSCTTLGQRSPLR